MEEAERAELTDGLSYRARWPRSHAAKGAGPDGPDPSILAPLWTDQTVERGWPPSNTVGILTPAPSSELRLPSPDHFRQDDV
jgi:hypothetical protein